LQTKTIIDSIIESGSKYSELAKDPDVLHWLRNLERGSAVTADASLRRLGKSCELLGLTPKQMIVEAQTDPKRFQDSLEDMVFALERENKSPGYVANLVKIVRQWLRYNNILVTRRIKIKESTATPTIADECVPTQQELAKLLRISSSRVRCIASLMGFAGLRPETIGNFDGSDGLKLSDLPEVVLEAKAVSIRTVPTMIVVRQTLSKAKHRYFSFIGAEGCVYLREYLEQRLKDGEQLSPNSPVITHERNDIVTKPFLLTRTVTRHLRDAMRLSGLTQRPYSLRAYFQTALTIAESKAKVSHAYIQFFSGHRGDMTAKYSTHKGALPPEMVEGTRSAYKQCEPFLSTMALPTDQISTVKEAKIEALKSIGKTLFGLDLLELKVAKQRSLERDLTQDEIIGLFEEKMMQSRINSGGQIIVTENELENKVQEGWEYVSTLPSPEDVRERLQ